MSFRSPCGKVRCTVFVLLMFAVFQITILLKDVTSLTKEKTAKLIPNAIQISTDNDKVSVQTPSIF